MRARALEIVHRRLVVDPRSACGIKFPGALKSAYGSFRVRAQASEYAHKSLVGDPPSACAIIFIGALKLANVAIVCAHRLLRVRACLGVDPTSACGIIKSAYVPIGHMCQKPARSWYPCCGTNRGQHTGQVRCLDVPPRHCSRGGASRQPRVRPSSFLSSKVVREIHPSRM